MRDCGHNVFQSSRKFAEDYSHNYDILLGVCPNRAEGVILPYLSHGVRDEDTPALDDIEKWVGFVAPFLCTDYRILVHCEAGQNRSAIIASLIVSLRTGEPWDRVVSRLHDEFLALTPPHNWQPYEHWAKAITYWFHVRN